MILERTPETVLLAEALMKTRSMVITIEDPVGNTTYCCPYCGEELTATYGADPWGEPMEDLHCKCGFASEDFFFI